MLLSFTTISLDYRLLKSPLVVVVVVVVVVVFYHFGGCQDGVGFLIDCGSLWELFRGQFWKHFSLHFCVNFWERQKVMRAAPRAAGSRRD